MLTPALRKKLLTTANYTVLILMALIALFPIYFMVIASFKNTEDLFRNGIQMVFEFDNLTAANYEYTPYHQRRHLPAMVLEQHHRAGSQHGVLAGSFLHLRLCHRRL